MRKRVAEKIRSNPDTKRKVIIVGKEPRQGEILVDDLLFRHWRNEVVSQEISGAFEGRDYKYDSWYVEDYNTLNEHTLVTVRFDNPDMTDREQDTAIDLVYERLENKSVSFDADGEVIAID